MHSLDVTAIVGVMAGEVCVVVWSGVVVVVADVIVVVVEGLRTFNCNNEIILRLLLLGTTLYTALDDSIIHLQDECNLKNKYNTRIKPVGKPDWEAVQIHEKKFMKCVE